jgi:hypothetical protein
VHRSISQINAGTNSGEEKHREGEKHERYKFWVEFHFKGSSTVTEIGVSYLTDPYLRPMPKAKFMHKKAKAQTTKYAKLNKTTGLISFFKVRFLFEVRFLISAPSICPTNVFPKGKNR